MPSSACPECGTPIAQSLLPVRIGRWPLHWIRRLISGLDSVIGAGWLLIFMWPLGVLAMGRAVYDLTATDDDQPAVTGRREALRGTARIAAVGLSAMMPMHCALACILGSSSPSSGRNDLLAVFAWSVMLTTQGVTLTATGLYAAETADDVARRDLSYRLRFAARAVAGCHGVVLIGSLWTMLDLAGRDAAMYVGLVAFVAGLGFWVWVLVMLAGIRTALKAMERGGWKLAPLRVGQPTSDSTAAGG